MSNELVLTDKAGIRHLLGKLETAALRSMAERLGAVRSAHDVGKRALLDAIMRTPLGNGLTAQQVADLDLKSIIINPRAKKWTALRLLYGDGAEDMAATVSVEPASLRERLSAELSVYFRHYTAVRWHEGAYWIRIGLRERERVTYRKLHRFSTQTDTIFVIHYPRTKFALSSTVKHEHRDFIHVALAKAFECDRVQPLSLSGRNLANLTRVVLERHAQGLAAAPGSANPLEPWRDGMPATAKPLTKQSEKSDFSTTRVVDEDRAEREERLREAEGIFGRGQLAGMEEVEYNLPHGIKVKFEGQNLAEGWRRIVELGLAVDIPEYVRNAHSLSSAKIYVKDDLTYELAAHEM